ncbi:MAG: nickel/cobalt transporter [Alphaproteobacteria bacterium]
MKTFLFSFIISSLLWSITPAMASPFGNTTMPQETSTVAAKAESPSFLTKAWVWIVMHQRDLNQKIKSQIKQLKETKSPKIFIYGLLLSFIYGVLHALGPGHGKLIMISYFSSKKSKLWHAPLMAFQISFFHTLSAIVLVLLTDKIAKSIAISMHPSKELVLIKIVSYTLIFLVGLFMLYQTYKANKACGCVSGKVSSDNSRANWLLSVSVGFVPCTGSLLILLFTMSYDVLIEGIFFVTALGLGIAVTLSAIGIFCIEGFDLLMATTKLEKKATFSKIIGYTSSSLITFIGSVLLFLSIKDWLQ